MEDFANKLTKFLENNRLNDLLNNSDLIDQVNCNYNEYISNEQLIKSGNESENTYQKILLTKSDKFDIYLFIWYPNCSTEIHDHAENGCFMKLLEGKLQETIYDTIFYKKQSTNTLSKGEYKYISNKLGYHTIKNLSSISVSIHIYSPPNHKTKYFSN
jgi:cysteine dioxygenase